MAFWNLKKETRNRVNITIEKNTKLTVYDIVDLISKDEKNIKLVHDAAKNGNLNCQIFLSQGAILSINEGNNDEGIYKNAELYTKLAATQGDLDSQLNLAQFYLKKIDFSEEYISEENIPVLRDALFWYKRASMNGCNDKDIVNAISVIEDMLPS